MKIATRPDVFSIPSLQKLAEKGTQVTDEERSFYGMSQSSGWPLFLQKKDNLLKDLEAFQEAAIANGKSKDEIGDIAILISLVRGVINRLWSFVDDAKEVCEGTGGQ